MSDKINKALEMFGPFSCSQAVLAAWCEDYGLDEQTALKISCGFGSGMARLSRTCGAVTGAYMAIGLKHGKCEPGDAAAKEKTFGLIHEFDRRFCEKHGTTNCKELLGVDLMSGDQALCGARIAERCAGFVKDATEILEAIL